MRFLVALALLFSITPGVSEVAEAAVHVIAHADLPHHNGDESGECNEHTCTPLAHHCGCHAAMSAQTTSRTVATSRRNVASTSSYTITTALGRVSEPPPLRPPIG